MGSVLAIANQKGGVGKTTTAVNLGASIAGAGYPTLLVDLDPQCNATVALGLAKDLSPNVYECLSGELTLAEAAIPSGIENLHVVPSTARPRRRDRRAAPHRRLGVRAARPASATSTSATCSPCSTARRRSARSRSTRSSRPTR